jgi:hypothetical protein
MALYERMVVLKTVELLAMDEQAPGGSLSP